MIPDFNMKEIKLIEFGVGFDNGGETFVLLPVDKSVQKALVEMIEATRDAIKRLEEKFGTAKYESSEKHASSEYLILPIDSIDNDAVAQIRNLHEAENLNSNREALFEPGKIFCYFVKFHGNKGKHLTALKRSSQFKGCLKSKNRLVCMMDDSLKIINDNVFKLDNDFDFFIYLENIHILHPSGFEFLGKMKKAILEAVPKNVEKLKEELKFVEFDSISEYASAHSRAARYLASILSQDEIKNVDKSALKTLCCATGIPITEKRGKLLIPSGYELEFLEVLDRRRYKIELVKDAPECFKAASRKKISG